MKEYLTKENKRVGLMVNGIYRSVRRKSKHLLKILDAWGIDVKILEPLKEDGCKEIRILDNDEGTVYTIDLDTFISKGIEKNFVGRQVFLPRKEWIKHTPS